MTQFFPELPVNAIVPQLKSILSNGNKTILVAPPGAGKTTIVPLSLLDEAWAKNGRIILLEPRRLAARSAAQRMASLLGEEVGQTVGYILRMDRKLSSKTRIIVVTEGILARMIIDDPGLEDVSTVIFDEFHERSLDADFGLALTLDIQNALRSDLRLIIMSATLDVSRVSNLLSNAPVLQSEGRGFPIELRHIDRKPTQPIETSVANAILALLPEITGNILAFLPGQREIKQTIALLSDRLPDQIDLVPLHGGLDVAAQDEAIGTPKPGRRKVVLATAIAETSITIDGITAVIDSGLSRLPKYEPMTGLTRLETVRVSKASADQRAGRAGRTAPGIAVRLWRKEQTAALPDFTPPEILDADLSNLVLDCAAFGVINPSALMFLDTPPVTSLAGAQAVLSELNALDQSGRLTQSGKVMRELALPVRLSHMIAVAAEHGHAKNASLLATILSERGLGGNSVDVEDRFERFKADRSARAIAAKNLSNSIARKAQTNLNIHKTAETVSAGSLLIHAWPDRVARARGEYGHFILSNGRGAQIDPSDKLAGEPWLVVADLQGQARNARITAACAITEQEVFDALADRIKIRTETYFDLEKRLLRQRQIRTLGAISLAERTLPVPHGSQADEGLIQAIKDHGISLLPWNAESSGFRACLAFLYDMEGQPYPDVRDAALLEQLENWLKPFLKGEANIASIAPSELVTGLKSLLPYDLQRKIDHIVPSHFTAPTGSRVPIAYHNGEAVLSIRVQELYGLQTHPTVGNSIPLTLELLSPARRPIQKTRDLVGFWRGSWSDVRSEMRGRYPKHPWPEDPASAMPTNKVKPRAK